MFSPKILTGLAIAFTALVLVENAGCSRVAKVEGTRADASGAVDAAKEADQSQATVESIDSTIVTAAHKVLEDKFHRLQSFQPLTDEEQNHLAGTLGDHVDSTALRLENSAAENDRIFTNNFEAGWIKLASERRRVAEARDHFEREGRKAQQTALALGTEHKWFWLASLLAIAALLAVSAVDRRHEIRRYLNGGRAKGLALGKVLVGIFGVLCILTTSLFFASDGILVDLFDRLPSTTSLEQIAKRSVADANTAAEFRTRSTNQQNELTGLEDKLKSEFGRILPTESGGLFKRWWAYWHTATKMQASVKAKERHLARFDEDLTAIKNDESAITTARNASKKWQRQANLLCGVIGIGIVLLVVFGAVLFTRSVKHRESMLAATCPMCLTVGKLENSSGDSGNRQLAEGMARCQAVISESPFEECLFDFPSMYRDKPKLCFPTLGIPAAGKTHWLSMVYRELNKGNFPKEVEFAKIRTSSSDDLDRLVNEILVGKLNPGANQPHTFPRPIVFNFCDHDSLGRSSILVNLFDYSGEVVRNMTLDDIQRKRAFTADGYFYFLDPTHSSEEQMQPLINFRNDVRIVKGLKAGQQIRCPVALCVSKIDLMPNENYARGGNAIENFYAALKDIGWGMDMRSIKKRSDLMRQLRNDIWPNWEIERQIDDLFGGRYMFFPLTPVGLNEPGETNLQNRTIAPVGIAHPLMWLLHMNGYPVLRSSK